MNTLVLQLPKLWVIGLSFRVKHHVRWILRSVIVLRRVARVPKMTSFSTRSAAALYFAADVVAVRQFGRSRFTEAINLIVNTCQRSAEILIRCFVIIGRRMRHRFLKILKGFLSAGCHIGYAPQHQQKLSQFWFG